jgi:rod shape-determining protein MreC
MPRLRPGQQQRFTIIGLIVICVALLVLDSQGHPIAGARNTADKAFGPVERGLNRMVDPVGTFFRGLPDVGSNKKKMDALHRQNDQLRSELRTSQVNGERAKSLERLGLFVGKSHFKVATASVLDLGPSLGFEWAVRIDAGAAQGVTDGMTVINADGLVGRVKQASSDTSTVVLAIDPGSSVGVRDARTGELGLATGAGLGHMHFTPLNPESKARKGDTLITGPYGASTYAAGVPLGTMTSATSIKPYVSYSSLDVLGVVLTAGKPSSRTPPQASGPGR